MTDYPAAIPMFAIQQLRCPKCRARMKLARTSPGPTGFELKRFDCSECDHVEQIAIPSDDPMKSDAVGWFLGERSKLSALHANGTSKSRAALEHSPLPTLAWEGHRTNK